MLCHHDKALVLTPCTIPIWKVGPIRIMEIITELAYMMTQHLYIRNWWWLRIYWISSELELIGSMGYIVTSNH